MILNKPFPPLSFGRLRTDGSGYIEADVVVGAEVVGWVSEAPTYDARPSSLCVYRPLDFQQSIRLGFIQWVPYSPIMANTMDTLKQRIRTLLRRG